MTAQDHVAAACLALGGDPFGGLPDCDDSDSDADYTDDERDSKRVIEYGALNARGVEAARRLTQEPVLSGLFDCRLFAAQYVRSFAVVHSFAVLLALNRLSAITEQATTSCRALRDNGASITWSGSCKLWRFNITSAFCKLLLFRTLLT